jgi:hypothetical protein
MFAFESTQAQITVVKDVVVQSRMILEAIHSFETCSTALETFPNDSSLLLVLNILRVTHLTHVVPLLSVNLAMSLEPRTSWKVFLAELALIVLHTVNPRH